MSRDQEILAIKNFLIENEITYLFHFTDLSNLGTIAKYGLLTKATLEKKGALGKIKTGGNKLSKNLDIVHKNWDKVSLSWCTKIPMSYYREQEQHLCYLQIDSLIAASGNVYFTDSNAVDSNHKREKGIQGLKYVDVQSINSEYPYKDPEEKRKKQAEILIPYDIESSKIIKISVRSNSALKEAKRRCHEL